MRFFSVRKKGFSLLEVMVAVGVLAVSLMVIIGVSVGAMRRSGRTEDLVKATMLARQKLADIEIEIDKGRAKGEFPDEKVEEGKFDEPFEKFSWKMEIRKVELPAPITGDKGSLQETVGRQLTKEISQTVRELKLQVLWNEKEGEEGQSVDVVTHIVKL